MGDVSATVGPKRRQRRSMLASNATELGVLVGDWVVRNDMKTRGRTSSRGLGGDLAEVGRILEINEMEKLVVEFPTGVQTLKPKEVQLAKTTGSVTTFGKAESFGEVSMLYNVKRIGSCYVSSGENAMVFAISKRDFKECLDQKNPQSQAKLRDWCDVLDEVPSLAQLLRSERMELAKTCIGEIHFSPDEVCIRRGYPRDPRRWYVVASGVGEIYAEEQHPELRTDDLLEQPGTIRRGAVFGERSLMKRTYVAEVTIMAGENGMVCLAFEEEALFSMANRTIITDPNSSLEEYIKGRVGSNDTFDEAPDCYNVDPSNLRKICMLGEGAFATVFLLEDRPPAGTSQRSASRSGS